MDVLLTIHWKSVFVPQHSLLELMLRGSLMYLAIFVLVRIMLRRQVGGIDTSDVLVVIPRACHETIDPKALPIPSAARDLRGSNKGPLRCARDDSGVITSEALVS